MFTTLYLVAILIFFANKRKALAAESICCEEIRALLINKTTAYQTVCLGPESNLSNNCCRKIEINLNEYRYAYKTLCPGAPKATRLATEPPVVRCNTPLGVENGNISDVAMTSSTILSATTLPHFARLRNQLGGCAWVPANTADRNSSWLQIDLGILINVSAVATQGSCDDSQWTKSYVFMYSRNGLDWKYYGELGIVRVFTGNNNTGSVVTNYFKIPLEARFVRISPRSWHKNAALRIELFTSSCNLTSLPRRRPPTPRSCLDHLKNGLRANGYYNIYDDRLKLATVFCDLTSEPRKAWTLFTSWAKSNKGMKEFRSQPLSEDAPVDERLPSWDRYRMSLEMMNGLMNQSTRWRATCSFPTHGVDFVDYVEGKIRDFDIVNFQGFHVCKKVEYANIRGHQCNGCRLPWWQKNGLFFIHTDSSRKTCGFNPTQDAVPYEDNFGYYSRTNTKFRCMADASATTNWWFGGSLA